MPFLESDSAPGASRTHLRLSTPDPSHGAAMWALARRSGLDENSPYAYVLWAEYFAETSVVVERDDEVVGFVSGFPVPAAPETVFVWQVAVDERQRGRGVGNAMLDALVDRLPWLRSLEATVTPSNAASAALFRAFAARHDAPVEEEPAFGAHLFPGGSHEAEIRFRIGPLRRPARRA